MTLERKPQLVTRKQLLTALEAIEELAGDDFCVELDMRGDDLTGDMKTAHDKLSRIYRISHSWIPTHACFGVHENWRVRKDLEVARQIAVEERPRTDGYE